MELDPTELGCGGKGKDSVRLLLPDLDDGMNVRLIVWDSSEYKQIKGMKEEALKLKYLET